MCSRERERPATLNTICGMHYRLMQGTGAARPIHFKRNAQRVNQPPIIQPNTPTILPIVTPQPIAAPINAGLPSLTLWSVTALSPRA